MTGQGLGGESAANGAGNPVLGDVGFDLTVRLDSPLNFVTLTCINPFLGRGVLATEKQALMAPHLVALQHYRCG